MSKILKTDAAGFVKDTSSGVVLNNNDNEYAAFIQNRERSMQMKKLTDDMNFLKQEFITLKQQFQSLIEKQNVNSTSTN